MSSKTRLSSPIGRLPLSLPQGGAGGAAPSMPAAWPVIAMTLILLTSIPAFLGYGIAQRALLAVIIFSLIMSLLLVRMSAGFLMLLVFLSFVGGIRRWLIPVFDWVPTDPLILIGPILTVLLTLFVMIRPENRWSSKLFKSIVALLGIMTLEVFNPQQGGLVVGFAGVLFYMIPLAWYFVGRVYCNAALMRNLFITLVFVSAAAAMYGIFQTFFGFNEGERMWMKATHIVAMNVTSNQVRAISFFTSPMEYDNVLGLATVVIFAMFVRGITLPIFIVPLLLVGIFLESGRGVFVSTLYSCVAVWAVLPQKKAQWLPRLVFALFVTIVGMYFVLTKLNDTDTGDQTSALVQHQTQGLLDPLNKQHSTVYIHQAMVLNGVIEGITDPIGRGLGSTTIAGAKFGAGSLGTEVDISDMFVALGFVGGIAYIAVICYVFVGAFRLWTRNRSWENLALIGMLVLEFRSWLFGDYYAVTMVLWLCVGGLDAANRRYEMEAQAALALSSADVTDAPVLVGAPAMMSDTRSTPSKPLAAVGKV